MRLQSDLGRRAQMEGMVNDLQLAREKQQQFDDWKKAGEKELAIELSVNVLTTGFWPTYKARPCCLPGWHPFGCRREPAMPVPKRMIPHFIFMYKKAMPSCAQMCGVL